jgi:hypothetical protein
MIYIGSAVDIGFVLIEDNFIIPSFFQYFINYTCSLSPISICYLSMLKFIHKYLFRDLNRLNLIFNYDRIIALLCLFRRIHNGLAYFNVVNALSQGYSRNLRD